MNHGQITFKPNAMEQMSLLLLRLDELIPAKHLVRVVNRVVDELDWSIDIYHVMLHAGQEE